MAADLTGALDRPFTAVRSWRPLAGVKCLLPFYCRSVPFWNSLLKAWPFKRTSLF